MGRKDLKKIRCRGDTELKELCLLR